MTLLKHPNGQWYKQIAGRRYYFGSIAADPSGEQAIREFLTRLPAIKDGTDRLRVQPAPGGWTAGELMGRYMAARRVDLTSGLLSGGSYRDYANELTLFVEWSGATTPIASIRPEHFAAYVQQMVEVRKLKSRARRRALACVKAMFRWGATNGYFVLPNFGTAFKTPAMTKAAMRREKARAGIPDYSERVLTGAEIDKLIEHAQPNMAAMILLGVNCGLGPADLGRMRWRHINMETGQMNYPRPKTGNDRQGYVWKRTRKALERVAKLRHTKRAIAEQGREALIFISRRRQPYYEEIPLMKNGVVDTFRIRNTISLTFGRLARRCNLDGVTFYRLRHTFKTAGKKSRDRDALHLCMGHTSNAVEAVYDHENISFKRLRRIAKRVKRQLWPINKQSATLQSTDLTVRPGAVGADAERVIPA